MYKRQDFYVFEQTCKFLHGRLESGKRAFPVSVNLSRRHFKDPDALAKLQKIAEDLSLIHIFLTVYQSWMAIISVFTTLNLSAGVFNNGMIKYPGQKNQFLSSLLGLSTTVTAVFFIVYLMFRQPINTLIELPTVLVLSLIHICKRQTGGSDGDY